MECYSEGSTHRHGHGLNFYRSFLYRNKRNRIPFRRRKRPRSEVQITRRISVIEHQVAVHALCHGDRPVAVSRQAAQQHKRCTENWQGHRQQARRPPQHRENARANALGYASVTPLDRLYARFARARRPRRRRPKNIWQQVALIEGAGIYKATRREPIKLQNILRWFVTFCRAHQESSACPVPARFRRLKPPAVFVCPDACATLWASGRTRNSST